MQHTDNHRIADRLAEAADLLEQQHANAFRVAAYRRAADTIRSLKQDLSDLLEDGGIVSLTDLPGIGNSLARAIAEMVHTGRWMQLERLRGMVNPEQLFQSIPGIGPGLAEQIHRELDVESLEELEAACRDGRLERLPGIGARRTAMLRAALAERLSRTRRWSPGPDNAVQPDIAMLLDVDREYRYKAKRGSLQKIAPKRFNPSGDAWLPILHTERGSWHFTALFSNTARAHELQRTDDWVVVYFHSDREPESQSAIVTETRGSLIGKRVVRGRERECRVYYETSPESRGGTSARIGESRE
ncbi:MAG: helix-hairpin-helix domain-containing protein [Alphaproteobacteria bacterium]|nr:helix-hairpin-helix domain-containing protein [Alphaproteobacteria bacterium]